MSNVGRFIIRVSAFVGKETFGILRQPMLLLTLVLGPFLILLLFGLGFRNEPQALRTLFVVAEGEPELAAQIEEYATSLGPQLVFIGVTGDKTGAMQNLLRRKVDVVVEVPANAYESVRNSEQVVLGLNHYEIDPFQIDYINIFGQVYADEVNRRVLQTITDRGQSESATIHDSLRVARDTTTELRQALVAGDSETANQHQQKLEGDVNTLTQAVGAAVGLAYGVKEAMGAGDSTDTEAIQGLLSTIQEDTHALNEIERNQDDYKTEEAQVEKIEDDLTQLETLLDEFQNIDPRVLVSPFRSETKSVATVTLRPSDFFAPAAIVLLLQHLAVTFGALSIVRERREGTMELFRVSPVSPLETLLGKYLSYLFFAGVLAAILSLVVIYVLGVPMLGNWVNYGLSLAALIFTSLGIGFVISLVANTDSQAVQYSMITLLSSVFFSGAFLSLHLLWEPVRVVSWAIPATYGIVLLQNIMLRGFLSDFILLSGLTAIGSGLFVVAWLLLRRLMARE